MMKRPEVERIKRKTEITLKELEIRPEVVGNYFNNIEHMERLMIEIKYLCNYILCLEARLVAQGDPTQIDAH